MPVSQFLALPGLGPALVKLLRDGIKTRFLFFRVTVSGAAIRQQLGEWIGIKIPEIIE